MTYLARGVRAPRGWAGAGAMAGACALALAAVALPLATGDARQGAGKARADRAAAGAAHRVSAPLAEQDCDPTASLRPSGADGKAVERIKKRGKLIAGVDQNSFLWGYRDPATGKIVGFDIDLVRAIADEILGDPDKVTYLTVPTDQRIPAIKSGKVDLIVRTMTITCDRLKDVAFSTVYFQAGQQLLVPKTSPIKKFDGELSGKRVCTARGSTGETALHGQRYGARIVTVPNQLDCLVRLQLGEVDAVLTDSALAAGQAAQDPAVHLVGGQLTKEPYGVAMNKADTDLVRRVNQVLENYRAGGGGSPWMRAFDRWLADDMDRPNGPPPAKYKD
jgi:polar amino acid transport system substrate-binding protein